MRTLLIWPLVCLSSAIGLAGQWFPGGPEGGRATALLLHPEDAQVLYAGGLNGVFESSDGGLSWSRVSQGLTDCRITDLALHPARPQVLFAASQEEGVFKSLDGGESWAPSSQGIFELRINDLEADPSDPDVLYAATRNGVFKSLDGGETWQDRSVGFLFDFFIESVAVAPSDPSVVYAATLFDGIYQSRDGADTWLRMAGQDGLDFNGALAVHPLDANHLFAGSNDGINITQDGQNWENVCILVDPSTGECFSRASLALAFEDEEGVSLLLGTNNGPRRLTVATGEFELLPVRAVLDSTPPVGVVAASPSMIAVSLLEGVGVSQDGGEMWRVDTAGFRMTPTVHLAIDPINPMRAYVSSEAGPLRTLDGGETWIPVRQQGQQAASRRLNAVYTDPSDLGTTLSITVGGSQRLSEDEGVTWSSLGLLGPGGQLRQLLPDYPRQRAFAVTAFGVSQGENHQWDFINEGLDGINQRSVALDRQSDRLWLAAQNALYTRFLTEDDDPWKPLSTQPPDTDLWSVAVEQDGQLILAGAESGLFISRDAGATWALAEDLPSRRVTSIHIEGRGQPIWVATWGQGVWRSIDDGFSFQPCGEGLESGFVSSVAARSGTVLAATQGGVFAFREDGTQAPLPEITAALGGTVRENGIREVTLQVSLPQDAPVLDHSGFELALSVDGRFQIQETDTSAGKLTLGPSRATLLWDGHLEGGQSAEIRFSLRVPDILEISPTAPFSVQSRAAVLLDGDDDGKVDRLVPSQPFSLSLDPIPTLRRQALVVPSSSFVEDGFVGLALTNADNQLENVALFTELSQDGSPLRPSYEGQPLAPSAQRARSVEELAQGPLDTLSVQLGSGLKGFFLMGDNASQRLDGVGARLIDAELSFIPHVRVGAGVQTRLFLFNPDTENPSQIALTFHDASGETMAQDVVELGPSASATPLLEDLISGLPAQAEGYLRLRAAGPFRAFALRDENGSFSSLAAVPASSHSTVFMPHFVVDPALGATTLIHVLNIGGSTAQAHFRVVCDDEPEVPIDFSIDVPGHGLLSLDLAERLPQDGQARQGLIELSVSGGDALGFPLRVPHLATATIEGGSLGSRSSLPFSAGHGGTVIIQQLAQSPSTGIFQGLAVVPRDRFGSGFIDVFDSTGQLRASGFFFLRRGERLIGLLDELPWTLLDPALREDFDITGGWISVGSRDLVVVSLFGGPNFLSAVEPEPLD
ncbi:MAG TPA: hypothetical protein VLV83_04485 [Acidobacteriota bacterium]|nr:hypothetical protein [Acidobacteriota bacterium]